MAKLTIDDLKKIKDQTSKATSLRHGDANVKITVHMGTCGIAAGAREVMNALMEEMAEADRQEEGSNKKSFPRLPTHPALPV